MPDRCTVFFRAGTLSLADAGHRLAERGLHVDRAADGLSFRWGEGPILHLTYAQGPAVIQEARTTSAGTPHAGPMAACDAKLEIRIDDLAGVLDEVNTLMEAQMTLQEATHGFIYCAWNKALTAPLG